jgi:hypothetical protein
MRELAACSFALFVFALIDLPIFFPLIAGYLAGWLEVVIAGPLIRRTGARVVMVLFALFGLRALYIHHEAMLESEGLAGIRTVFADRLRMEAGARDVPFQALERPRFTCAAPEAGLAAALSEESDTLYLANRSGDVEKREVAKSPSACVYAEDTLVTAHRTGELYVGAKKLAFPGELTALAFHGGKLAIGIRGAEALGERTGVILASWPEVQELGFYPFPEAPDWLVSTPRGFVAALRRGHRLVELESNRSLYLGRPAITLSTTPDRRYLVAPVTGVFREGDAGANHQIDDQLLFIDTDLFRVTRSIPLKGSPVGAVATSTSSYTVALAGFGRIAGTELERDYAGVYGLADLGHAVLLATAPAREGLLIFGPGGVLYESSAKELNNAQKGELAFFEATRSGVSCGSCHLHADSDLSFHDIGHGRASPTLSVRGIAHTSPYLRGASYPTLGSLDTFAETLLGGYERELPDRAELLESFIVTLAPHAPPIGLPPRESGREAFAKAGCTECHHGPAYTNLAQVPASYLFPELGKTNRLLDTPALLNIRNTAPYLDDGRAQTLREVLVDHNMNNRHGDVRALNEEELNVLLLMLGVL